MPDLTPERLAAIRERHEAATDGPWWFDESADTWRLHGVAFRVPPQADGSIPEQIVNKQILKAAKQGTPYAEYWPDKADAAFIAGAWKDVRDLLAEVDRLNKAASLLGGQLQGGAQTARDLARVIDVVALEIRRAVRLTNAGDLAAAMEVITEWASEADWLDNLDADDEGGESHG